MDEEYGYNLSCALELGEISPVEEVVFRENTTAREYLRRRMELGERPPPSALRQIARAYLASAKPVRRHVLSLLAMQNLEYGLHKLAERVEFAVQTKIISDLGAYPLGSLAFIPEISSAKQEVCFRNDAEVTPDRVQAFLEKHFGESRQMLMADLEAVRQGLEWAAKGNHRKARRYATRFLVEPDSTEFGFGAPTLAQVCKTTRKRPSQHKARQAIKRVVQLFANVGAEQNLRLLIRGQEAEISHPNSPFKFVVSPYSKGWLETQTTRPTGHSPFQITLLTRENVFISRLCVLFDKTPVLDQLLALTLFIKSGEEQTLLEKANWFGYKPTEETRELLRLHAPSLIKKITHHSSCTELESLVAPHAKQCASYQTPVRNWVAQWLEGAHLEIARLMALADPKRGQSSLPVQAA